MDGAQRDDLTEEVRAEGHAYVRNRAAAEAAVLRGQFNLTKVLRALAHAQRTQALAARLPDPAVARRAAPAELAWLRPRPGDHHADAVDADRAARLARFSAT